MKMLKNTQSDSKQAVESGGLSFREMSSSRSFARTKGIITLVQWQLVLLLIAVYYFHIKEVSPESADKLLYPLSVVAMGQYCWALWSWKRLTHSIFDLYVVFLTSATLFNVGHAFLEVFALNRYGILGGRFSDVTTLKALYLSVTSLAAMHLGATVSIKPGGYQPTNTSSKWISPRPEDLRIVGGILLAISSLFVLQRLTIQYQTVSLSGYEALYQGEKATGVDAAPAILAQFFVPGCMFLLAGNRNHFVRVALLTCVVLAYTLMMLILGYRGWNLLFLVGYIWLFSKTIRPIPKWILLGGLGVVALVVPLVRIVRGIPAPERPSLNTLLIEQMTIANPLVEFVSETGGSLSITAYTLELVPEQRDFEYGKTYGYALLTIIPNVWGGVHPGVEYANLGQWITRIVSPYTYDRGGGLGFSFIAEAYLNFKWFGATVFLVAVGFGLARLTLWGTANRDPARLGMIACVIAFLPFAARADASVVTRGIAWYSVLPYIGILLLATITRRLTMTTHRAKQEREPSSELELSSHE